MGLLIDLRLANWSSLYKFCKTSRSGDKDTTIFYAGIKLEKDLHYTITAPKSLHLSNAVLCIEGIGRRNFDCYIEVHLVLDKVDHVIGIVGGSNLKGETPIMQASLNLRLQPSVPAVLYTKKVDLPSTFGVAQAGNSLKTAPFKIQVTGYFTD